MSYRKRLASDVEPSMSSDHTPSETSIASRSLLGKRQFHETKMQFINLIDQYNEANLGTFTFVVKFSKGGINVTHEDLPIFTNY